MDVVFVHGWGFHPGVWGGLVSKLENITPHYIDLGFIKGFEGGTEVIPDHAIAIGHSLGSLWLLKQNKPFRAFVSIGGFDNFHTYIPAHEMKAMQRRLDRAPWQQMQGFWQASGTNDFCREDDLNIPALKEGLDWLMTWEINKPSCPTLALASRDDMIVPPDMSAAVWGEDKITWADDGGHALPLTKTVWCAEKIQDFIQGFIDDV